MQGTHDHVRQNPHRCPECGRRLGGVNQRTIDRWTADPNVGFPQPIYIRARKYRSAAAVEAFETRLIEGAGKDPVSPLGHRALRKPAPATA